jgi:cell division septation protein DedD
VRKKNKRKAPEFKKPFIVLTRKKIVGWSLLIFFLCAWMFVLGVLVGRGTAPLKFDLAALEKKLAASGKDESVQEGKARPQEDAAAVKDKTKLDFYEALKEDKEDTKVAVLPKPKAAERPVEKPAEKDTAPAKTANKSQSSEPAQQKTPPKEKAVAVANTNTTGPTYTIQAAAVRNAKDADRLIQKLKKRGYPAYRTIGKVQGKGIWFRVRIGSYKSKAEARRTLDQLKKEGHKPILVLRQAGQE